MRLLLDTHVLLWMLDDSPKLGRRARGLMEARGTDIFVSARVARLPRHHADPFDRALVAQALVEPLTLLTRDAKLAAYGSVVRVA